MKTIYWNYFSNLFIIGFLVLYVLEKTSIISNQSSLQSLLVVMFLITTNQYYKRLLKEKDQEIFQLKQLR